MPAGRVGVVVHLDGPGLGRVPGEVALALEHGQVGVDGGRGGEPDRLADLAHRGRIAPLPLAVGDEVEDLLPLPAQDLGHRVSFGAHPAVPPGPSRGRTSVRDRPTIASPAVPKQTSVRSRRGRAVPPGVESPATGQGRLRRAGGRDARSTACHTVSVRSGVHEQAFVSRLTANRCSCPMREERTGVRDRETPCRSHSNSSTRHAARGCTPCPTSRRGPHRPPGCAAAGWSWARSSPCPAGPAGPADPGPRREHAGPGGAGPGPGLHRQAGRHAGLHRHPGRPARTRPRWPRGWPARSVRPSSCPGSTSSFPDYRRRCAMSLVRSR